MSPVKRIWQEDERVEVKFDNEVYSGLIVEIIGKQKAIVLFDDGDTFDLPFSRLKLPTQQKQKRSKTLKIASPNIGFNQYNIIWDSNKINFKFKADENQFYGWWRKTEIAGLSAYAIDIYCESQSHRYNVECLSYLEIDPRNDLYSLNADICAATNKWFYYKCNGTYETIEQLRLKADKPTITVKKLETIDKIIVDLKEFRDTAIRCGGFRVAMFTGDDELNDPTGGLRIHMDLTTQALGYKGRSPKLLEGTALDNIGQKKSEHKKGKVEYTANTEYVDDLMEKLKNSKDKKEKRKIRSILRKMGIRGGIRSYKNGEGEDTLDQE